MSESAQVIVIGGGHAGCEAALASARMGVSTILVTLNLDTIALMPCNPSVGGQGKGQLVREIDALGGQMGIIADETNILARLLNTRKGLAVQSLRVQSDKTAYGRNMLDTVLCCPNLTVVQALISDIIVENGRVTGIRTQAGDELTTGIVVLTPGTFLRGVIHIGKTTFPAGRAGEPPADDLGRSLDRLGLPLKRFKTGTPPRVEAKTIDYSGLEVQVDEKKSPPFSLWSKPEQQFPRSECHLTRTTKETHAIIREHLHESALVAGRIKGTGPRYCPSIEDKIQKFPDKESHKVFLEPEGSNSPEVYLQGLSTSLPETVQEFYVRSLPGLENACMTRPGYAIEYDIVDSASLLPTLMNKRVHGLFLAGQVNGTSGYEEAAAQGLLAGMNAAALAQGKPGIILSPASSFIGLMLEEITTQGLIEPYRIFTSRSQHRLHLRMSNAEERLSHIGNAVGVLSDERYARVQERQHAIRAALEEFEKTPLPSDFPGSAPKHSLHPGLFRGTHSIVGIAAKDIRHPWLSGGTHPIVGIAPKHIRHPWLFGGIHPIVGIASSGPARDRPANLSWYMKQPGVCLADFFSIKPDWQSFDSLAAMEIETQIKYQGYLVQQDRENQMLKEFQDLPISKSFLAELPSGLSIESRQRISAVRPSTLGSLSRIPGIRATDVAFVLMHLRKNR